MFAEGADHRYRAGWQLPLKPLPGDISRPQRRFVNVEIAIVAVDEYRAVGIAGARFHPGQINQMLYGLVEKHLTAFKNGSGSGRGRSEAVCGKRQPDDLIGAGIQQVDPASGYNKATWCWTGSQFHNGRGGKHGGAFEYVKRFSGLAVQNLGFGILWIQHQNLFGKFQYVRPILG